MHPAALPPLSPGERGRGEGNPGDTDFHQGYRYRFSATPWDIPFRPPLAHPKPRVLGSQSAVVTGPAGEEIHCDEYGRIKVQFFWDRHGQADDKTSCWLRVSNSWAGDNYGGIAIPRIGMEVLVTFLEGDPDQPLVTGCLYHKEHVVPYDLPANKTRSLFKTLSTPGGGGYNELRIEDKKGEEQIYLHAERDWDENIEHDQKIRVGNERHDSVEANSFTELKAEEHLTVKAERKVEVKPDDHLSVGQNQHIKLGTAQLTKAGREIHLKAGQKMVIEAGVELTLKAGGSFIKLDPGGITLSGPLAKINAGGSPGKGSGIGILAAALPLIADQARAGNLLDRARKQEHYDEQVRFVTRRGTPIKGVKTAIILPSDSAPKLSKSDADGRHPRIQTNGVENAKVHLLWDELVVPTGADDYETSRNKLAHAPSQLLRPTPNPAPCVK